MLADAAVYDLRPQETRPRQMVRMQKVVFIEKAPGKTGRLKIAQTLKLLN